MENYDAMDGHTGCIIQSQNLAFSFNKKKEFIKGVNINVSKRSIYGFLGPNGAGKTTVIKLLLGLLDSKEGTVNLFGKKLSDNRIFILSRIGTLIEQPSLYEHISGYDNLDVVRRIKKINPKKIDEVLEIVKLKSAAKYPAKTYSLGMKQRLGIALALLGNPQLLILDEPVNGLDPNGISEIRELLVSLNNMGVTIFLSSHLLGEVEKIATHVGIINCGKMIFQGSIHELQKLQSAELRISLWTNNATAASQLLSGKFMLNINEDTIIVNIESKEQAHYIIKLLIDHDILVYEASIVKKNLEQLFLSLTV